MFSAFSSVTRRCNKRFLAIQAACSLQNARAVSEGKWYSWGAVKRRNDGEKLRRALELAAWHLLRNTKVLDRCNSSAVAKQKDSGTKLELINCLIVYFTRTL